MDQPTYLNKTDNAIRAISLYDTGLDPFSLSLGLARVGIEPSSIPGAGIRDKYNFILTRFYHNEAFIKATFIKKVLTQGKHVTVFEFPVCGSRTDLVKVNGHSVVYEIKTSYDTFYRLDKQISDYAKVFDYLYVICPLNKVGEAMRRLPSFVGIYGYKDRGQTITYALVRKAVKNIEISPVCQLSCLSQSEIQSVFHTDQKKENFIDYYLSHPFQFDVAKGFRDALKKRYGPNWDFLKANMEHILEIDYQWFFKSMIPPSIIYE